VLIFGVLFSGIAWGQDDSEENYFSKNNRAEKELIEEERFLTFEQNFMDAVQYRATENYKKALEFLNNCDDIYPENVAMLFEMAKNHFSLNQYIEASHYCENALRIEPNNFWIRNLKKEILLKERNLPEALELQKQLYSEKNSEAENLLNIYFQMRDIENGKKLLKEVDQKAIFVENIKFYSNYFEKQPVNNSESDSLKMEQNNEVDKTKIIKTSDISGDFNTLLEQMKKTDLEKNYKALLDQSNKTLELFPAQALAYYYNGLAQNGLKKYQNAITILENGLDFVLDDNALTINFYEAIILAYSGLGNTSKVNYYKQLVQKLK
jgi:tetratricopeptide (TPR) repeat protein